MMLFTIYLPDMVLSREISLTMRVLKPISMNTANIEPIESAKDKIPKPPAPRYLAV